MENIVKQLKKVARHARLSATEKSEIKNELLRYVKANPVQIGMISLRPRRVSRHGSADPSADSGILSPFSINSFRNKKTLSAFVIGGLLIGSSVSFASENAVPGDLLYPVKIHINEQVRGFVAVTPKAKAEWEVHLVERRLEEVEKLAVTPNVPIELQQIAEQNLASYTKEVKNRIAKFEEEKDSEDAIGTASDLSNILSIHEQILTEMSTSASSTVVVTIATNTLATTTLVDTPTYLEAESVSDILGKVREAYGDAEKKHKELKGKYHKGNTDEGSSSDDGVVSSNSDSTLVLNQNSAAGNVATSTSAFIPLKINHSNSEYIQTASSSAGIQIEARKRDNKESSGTHPEISNIDNND